MFVSSSMICNYADDTTIYASDYKKEEIIRNFENDTAILPNWFRDNSIKVNGEKCHLMFFSNVQNTSITIKCNNELIRVQKKSRLHGCEPEEGFLSLYQF